MGVDTQLLEEQYRAKYNSVVGKYLEEAEAIFGENTADYKFIGVHFHDFPPQMIFHDKDFLTNETFFKINLSRNTIGDDLRGIFQLSHEVVHLISPVHQKNNKDCENYLEEGMAVHFSKIITERRDGGAKYFEEAIKNEPDYQQAFSLYQRLIAIDPEAVSKLREYSPVVAHIQPEDFAKAGLNVPTELIRDLLKKFRNQIL